MGASLPAVAALLVVAAAVDDLLAADLTVAGTAEILDLLRDVETQTRRLYTASIGITAQIHARGLATPAGASSTAALVRQVVPLAAGDAYQRVRLAAATCVSTGLTGAPIAPALPILAAALQQGSVGAAHAGIIVCTLTGFPADVPAGTRDSVETFLVEQAAVLDPKTFHNVARRIALMANPDGPYDERDAADKQQFHISRRRDDGLTRCWGLLDDLTVEALRTALGALCAPAGDRTRPAAADADAVPGTAEAPAPPDPSTPSTPTTTATTAEENRDPDGSNAAEHRDDADQPNNADQANNAEHRDAADQANNAEHRDDADQPNSADRLNDADDGTDADHPHPDPDASPDLDPDAPTQSTDDSAPRRPWRPSRPPYEWAPLGTVPGDYPSPAAPPSAPDRTGPDGPGTTGAGRGDPADESSWPPASAPAAAPPPDRRSAATRRAHALSTILTAFLNAGTAPTIHGEKPHLLVTLSVSDLRHATGSAQLGYGDTIPIAAARMLACDASVIPAVLRGAGEVLDVGRAMRTFTAACRKAILLRDIGCVFPGCPMPGNWCDNHHIRHWADGGPSDLANAALLCRRHHTFIHRGPWVVRAGRDGAPEILPPATHDPAQRPQRNTIHRPPTFRWPVSAVRTEGEAT